MSASVLCVAKVARQGHSVVFTLPKILREQMGLAVGDMICIRVHLPYATFCKWPRAHVPHLAEIPQADRPPLEPRRLTSAATAGSEKKPTDRAATPDSRGDGRAED